MKWLTAALAAASACAAVPAQAGDFREADRPVTSVYLRIPLDGGTRREQLPVWGFAVQGKRNYEVLSLDSQMITRFADMGFVESKILLVGVLAGGAALAVAGAGGKSAAAQQQQQQQAIQQQAAQQQAKPPSGTPSGPCVCPAPK